MSAGTMKFRTHSFLLFTIIFLIMSHSASAHLYYNSSEPGCDGSDPNILWCDDFEDGDWAQTYSSTALESNDGWVMNQYGPGCNGGCTDGVPLVGSPAKGVKCGMAGVAGTNCAASSGMRSGSAGQPPFMGDHNFVDQQSVDELYFRYYLKDLPGSVIGQEKMLSVNTCCAGIGGIKFANHFTWPGSRIIQVTVVPEDVNRQLNISNIGSLTIGRWWYIEYHIKLNTPGASDGIWEAWINDCGVDGTSCSGSPTLRARHTNVKWRNAGDNSKMGSLWLENWANPGGSGETHYDQIKVSKIGPIGFTKSNAPTLPRPLAPKRLRIN